MSIDELFGSLVGHRIQGGCEDCIAYQTVKIIGRVFVLTIHHDDTCPVLRRHRGEEVGA